MYELACRSPGEGDATMRSGATSSVRPNGIPAVDEDEALDLRPAPSNEPARTRTLARNEILIRKGDRKTQLYRVESGALCIYDPRWNGHRAIIEFAFPGALVGLGFLEHHALSARALVETRVACLPMDQMDSLVAGDAQAEAKLGEAIEREFELRKELLVEAGRQNPIERVAALLVSLSRCNEREGRDPSIITEAWDSAVVADHLQLDDAATVSLLAELHARGLIEPSASAGLHLKDLDALEVLAARVSLPEPADNMDIDEAISDVIVEARPAPRVYRKEVDESSRAA